MPAPTLTNPLLSLGPGYLFYAPLGSTLPTNTVTASVFSDAWASPWVPWGKTEEGHVFSFQTTREPIEVAEDLDPIAHTSTSRQGRVTFSVANITAANIKRALNGGTLTTTGSTTTTKTEFTPPTLGQEVGCMLGWESQDSTERFICEQVFNVGNVELGRRKGAAKTLIPIEFALELPSSGFPFRHYTAGVARAGA